MMTTNPAADAAREAARDKTGEFGLQDHAEAGVVDAPTGPSAEDVEAVLYAMEWVNMVGAGGGNYDGGLDDFEGFEGDWFELEVRTVSAGVMATEAESPRPLEMAVIPDATGGPTMIQVGAFDDSTGLSATNWFPWTDMTTDRNATGRDAARGIARMLLVQRDEMRGKLEKYLGPIVAE